MTCVIGCPVPGSIAGSVACLFPTARRQVGTTDVRLADTNDRLAQTQTTMIGPQVPAWPLTSSVILPSTLDSCCRLSTRNTSRLSARQAARGAQLPSALCKALPSIWLLTLGPWTAWTCCNERLCRTLRHKTKQTAPGAAKWATPSLNTAVTVCGLPVAARSAHSCWGDNGNSPVAFAAIVLR